MIKGEKEMFTYIKLKNFMSFKEATFDFRNGKKNVKKFISIYGENGSGKSNFVNSIDLLLRSVNTFSTIEEALNVISGLLLESSKLQKDDVKDLFENTDFELNLTNYRMLECEEQTNVEYGFEFNSHKGFYSISFNNRFVCEKLYYYTGEQSEKLFEIKYVNGKIDMSFSNKLFLTKKVETEIKDEINKFWGKRTFLNILNKEREDKNEQYIQDNYLKYVFDILDMLQEITLNYKKTSHFEKEINAYKPDNMLKNLDEGKIKIKYKNILDCSERILKEFFTQAYSDIKDLFYERSIEKDEIIYKLFIQKMIGGKIRTVDFAMESAGTQHILEIIRALLGAFCGVIVVYDEIDNGIHDLLLKSILTSMIDDITGQLIITTHNTYMLETTDIKSVYVINIDYQGNKEVKCLDKYCKIQGTNNPRNMYLKGLFGGVPIVDIIDYDSILEELKSYENVEGGE